jgi:predicted 3-demethylubiquinone-9 3-methyltransferase (glyoxalase superfamily)
VLLVDPFDQFVRIVGRPALVRVKEGFYQVAQGLYIRKCGWLRDRYGLCWQIVPKVLGEMMKDPDRTRAKRVAEAMLQMVKLDIAGLKRAYEGP